jgi:protease I
MSSDYGFLNIARKTGVEIVEKDCLTLWQGPVSGKVKPQGPLAGKLIAPICHGAIPMAAADLVEGKHLAGVGACNDAVTIMGGAHSGDWSAVIDGQIVSGRVPVDVPEFLDAITTALLM